MLFRSYTNTNTDPEKFHETTLIPLTDPKTYTAGAAGKNPVDAKKENPFYKTYLLGTAPTYTSTKTPEQLKSLSEQEIKQAMTPTHWELAIKLKYNPDKDNGSTNKAYFVDNYRTTVISFFVFFKSFDSFCCNKIPSDVPGVDNVSGVVCWILDL